MIPRPTPSQHDAWSVSRRGKSLRAPAGRRKLTVRVFRWALKTQPRRQLKRARSARSENRADPIGRLPESVVWIGAPSGCCRRTDVGGARQRPAVTGQIGDVENVEAFGNQVEFNFFSNGDDARHAQIMRQETVSGGEVVRQHDECVGSAKRIAIRAPDLRQLRIFRRGERGIVLIHQPPYVIGILATTEGIDIGARQPEHEQAIAFGIELPRETVFISGLRICIIVDNCQPFRTPRNSFWSPPYFGKSQIPLMEPECFGVAPLSPKFCE